MVLAGHSAFICLNAVTLPPHHKGELWEMEERPADPSAATRASVPVRVLIVDDHDVFRHGLAQLLRDEGVDVVAEASGGAAGVRLTAELRPDVVLMDLSMPGISGVDATRAIIASDHAACVVVLTLDDDDAAMLEALLAGAAGYLLKEASLEQIVAAIRAAAAGDAVIPPRVAPEILRRLRAAEPVPWTADDSGAGELSERELEVLRLVVDGRDNAAIAAELFISPNTVKRHVASICAKLGVESRLQAAVQALRRGLVV
jgi:DNA-binding NarL/FixJ family response regulator